MGLMRALTLKRTSTLRLNPLKSRPQISLPTELISTTNNISYTAPSVESMQQKAATASTHGSDTEAETTSAAASVTDSSAVWTKDFAEYPATPTTASEPPSRRSSGQSDSAPSLTDASSVSSSPTTPPTHHTFTHHTLTSPLTGYFTTDPFSKPSSRNSPVTPGDSDEIDPFTVVAPALPRRAPSHSKREHERLARRRSQRVSMKIDAAAANAGFGEDVTVAPLTAAMPELVEVAEEVEVAVPAVTVVEVAEEGEEEALDRLMREMVVAEEEATYMRERNLKKFSVSGYLDLVGEMWGMESYVVDDVAVVA